MTQLQGEYYRLPVCSKNVGGSLFSIFNIVQKMWGGWDPEQQINVDLAESGWTKYYEFLGNTWLRPGKTRWRICVQETVRVNCAKIFFLAKQVLFSPKLILYSDYLYSKLASAAKMLSTWICEKLFSRRICNLSHCDMITRTFVRS